MASKDDLDDDDIDADEDENDYGEAEAPDQKLISLKQKWRDIEIQRESRILEHELGEKLDRNIFD